MSVLSNRGHVYESESQNSQSHSADNRPCHQHARSPFILSRSLLIGTPGRKAGWIRGNNFDPPYSYKQVSGLCHVRRVYLSIGRAALSPMLAICVLRYQAVRSFMDVPGVTPSAFDESSKFASVMARSNSELENKLLCSFRMSAPTLPFGGAFRLLPSGKARPFRRCGD